MHLARACHLSYDASCDACGASLGHLPRHCQTVRIWEQSVLHEICQAWYSSSKFPCSQHEGVQSDFADLPVALTKPVKGLMRLNHKKTEGAHLSKYAPW